MIINEICVNIVKNAKDGETIRNLANRIGFAYSAVYNWVLELEKYEIIRIIRKGNKNIIKLNKNELYNKFKEFDDTISVIDKDREFWNFIKGTTLNVRFVKGSAIAIWTKGGFITGDFYDKIYFLETTDIISLKKALDKKEIYYTESNLTNKRPLVYIIPNKKIKINRINNLPVMPLKELVKYCTELYLDNVLEQLDLLYNLGLNKRYSEVYTNT